MLQKLKKLGVMLHRKPLTFNYWDQDIIFKRDIVIWKRSPVHEMGCGILAAGHVFSQMFRKRMHKKCVT